MILPSDTEELRKVIERQWSVALSLSEYRVLMMVFDRTMGWGKVWEKITYRQFIDGVQGGDGTVWHCGTGLTPATVSKCLSSLTEMRLLFRNDKGKYSINQAWTPMMKEPKKVRSAEPTLAMPRASRMSGEDEPQSLQTISKRGGKSLQNLKCPTSKSIVDSLQNLNSNIKQIRCNQSKIKTDELRSSDAPEDESEDTSTLAALHAANAAIIARRQKVVSRMKSGATRKQADLEVVWVAACAAVNAHYLHVAWTNVQKARLSSIFRRFPADQRGAFSEFLSSVVQQWAYYREQLPWIRLPDEPSIPPLLTHYQALLDVWRGDRTWQQSTGTSAPSGTATRPAPERPAERVATPAAPAETRGYRIVAAAPRSAEEEL